MTYSQQNPDAFSRTQEADVSVIRREFVALTGDHFSAVILNQLLYWTQRVKDFDLLLKEERFFNPACNVLPRHGWIYKTANELNEETMLGISHPTMRKYLMQLIEQGWIDERPHPIEKWNKTTQYRVNFRKIQNDLKRMGRSLPSVYVKAFGLFHCETRNVNEQSRPLHAQERKLYSDVTSEEAHLEVSLESAENQNVRNLHSNERNLHSDVNSEEAYLEVSPESAENPNVRNLHSNESCLHSNERFLHSNVRNLHSYTYTENTTENKSKEHSTDARACQNFADLKNAIPDKSGLDKSGLDKSVSEGSSSEKSVAEEMVGLWENHVVQKLEPSNWQGVIHLNEQRKDQLEALFAFYFKNDIQLWERFCLRVTASAFLMGGGANGWKVTLDWVLCEANLLKIFEGNYDDSKVPEPCDWKLEPPQANPIVDAEKTAIVDSIKDPIWKTWCGRLAAGVRLNELKMLHEPLSVSDLRLIANARFLECEEGRLVWVGSSDQRALNRIDNLRLKISWVFAAEHPKASTFRTRLETSTLSHQPQITGEIHAQ